MSRLIIPLITLVLFALACGSSQAIVIGNKNGDRIVNLEDLELMGISEQEIPDSLREELEAGGWVARKVAMIFQEGVSTQRQQEILDAHDLVLTYRGSRLVMARTNTDDLDPIVAALSTLPEIAVVAKDHIGGELDSDELRYQWGVQPHGSDRLDWI